MSAPKIMVVRHAEKPEGQYAGVDTFGATDGESLIVQGWQRAGALAVLFDPARGSLQNSDLAVPAALFAAKFEPTKESKRPYETLLPLWSLLGSKVPFDYTFKRADYSKMVDEALKCTGTVLIAWQHEDIPAIGNKIVGNKKTVPQSWPGDRFDMVWVFDYNATTSSYDFNQVPQLVLAGDSSSPIK